MSALKSLQAQLQSLQKAQNKQVKVEKVTTVNTQAGMEEKSVTLEPGLTEEITGKDIQEWMADYPIPSTSDHNSCSCGVCPYCVRVRDWNHWTFLVQSDKNNPSIQLRATNQHPYPTSALL